MLGTSRNLTTHNIQGCRPCRRDCQTNRNNPNDNDLMTRMGPAPCEVRVAAYSPSAFLDL